jgi:hypothetical protein|uniref:Nucleotide-diphospho-sugar transferase domain-containing protein n=1 Tax=viral metagenome TaxID=1070528 RepID=A0A6C0LGV6_9ZZZZ
MSNTEGPKYSVNNADEVQTVADPPEVKKKIIFGLPGDTFSSKFLLSWTATINALWESKKYDIIVSTGVSSYVTFARMQTLGLDVMRGISQKPFDNMDFDVWITIDSDVIFTPQQVMDLIESTEVHPVVSGMYRMSNLTSYAIVKDWDTEYFAKNGTFKFLTPDEVTQWKTETSLKYMPVNYTGMGFFAMTRDVLRKMSYPYFNADLQEIITDEGKILRDLCSEDVAFCKNIQKLGIPIVINTDIRVGHNKLIVI